MTTDSERQVWLAERRKGIGASEAAAVCDLSPWTTPLEVYLDKTEQVADKPMTPAQRIGLLMEPVVAQLYEEAMNTKLVIPAQHQVHPDFPFIRANPDRSSADGAVNVQLKTAAFKSNDWGPPLSDEVPLQYLIQVQHEMLVTGQKLTHLAVLFLQDKDFCVYVIEPHGQLIHDMLAIERHFWTEFVEKRVAPSPTWKHPSTLSLIQRLYVHVAEGQVKAVPENDLSAMTMLVAQYAELGRQITRMQGERDEAKSRLLWAIGEAAGLAVGGDYLLTRKEVSKAAYQVAASKHVELRVKDLSKQKGDKR
jgi:putative phage-type endonuclease